MDNRLEILRPGLVNKSAFSEIAEKHGLDVVHTSNTEIKSPGMLEEHYQPTKPLYVIVEDTLESAKKRAPETETHWFELNDRPEIAARELYQSMRKACDSETTTCSIWIKRSSVNEDTWRGILDRLKKASSRFIE